MKTIKLKPVEYIMDFAKGENLKGKTAGGKKSKLQTDIFGGIKRVWNDGNGLLKLAQFDDNNVLFLNLYLLSKKEVKELKSELDKANIKHKFVVYGYPDYYNKSLPEMLTEEEKQLLQKEA